MTNKKIILTFLAIIFSFIAKPVMAECDGFYIAGRGGYAKYDLEDDRSGVNNSASNYIVDKKRFMASGALGYRYRYFRGELEYVWRKKNDGMISDITQASFKSQSYMFVVYYDLFPFSWFTPFINAGVGMTQNKLNINIPVVGTSYSVKDDNFTWSLGAGISAKITNRWNLDIGYRYYNMGDLDTLNGNTEVTDQEVYMGLRYVL